MQSGRRAPGIFHSQEHTLRLPPSSTLATYRMAGSLQGQIRICPPAQRTLSTKAELFARISLSRWSQPSWVRPPPGRQARSSGWQTMVQWCNPWRSGSGWLCSTPKAELWQEMQFAGQYFFANEKKLSTYASLWTSKGTLQANNTYPVKRTAKKDFGKLRTKCPPTFLWFPRLKKTSFHNLYNAIDILSSWKVIYD